MKSFTFLGEQLKLLYPVGVTFFLDLTGSCGLLSLSANTCVCMCVFYCNVYVLCDR